MIVYPSGELAVSHISHTVSEEGAYLEVPSYVSKHSRRHDSVWGQAMKCVEPRSKLMYNEATAYYYHDTHTAGE